MGHIFAASGSAGRLYKLHDNNNTVVHDATFAGAGEGIYSTPAAWPPENGDLYFGCWDQRIYCVDPSDMSLVWRTDTYASRVFASCAISSPTEVLFTATESGRILAFDAQAGGDPLWDYDLRSAQQGNWPGAQILSSLAISSGRLFIVAGDSTKRRLYCFGP